VSSRRRFGVALVLEGRGAVEVDALRRALGDPALSRIPPHLTLVPPVNVRSDRLGEALDVLRSAAGSVAGPVRLTLGRPSTFSPVNPVLYLAVGGDLEALGRLRRAVFRAPLERPLTWPWVPHVTLADGVGEGRIAAGLEALAGYSALWDVERVVLLEEGRDRVWSPLADAALGPAARVGTGGLPLELVRGTLVDPRLDGPSGEAAVTLNAYRDGQPVGWGRALPEPAGFRLEWSVRDPWRGEGVEEQLAAHLRWAATVGAYSKATEA
jgi:2'-5' RNA ligase